MRVKAPRLVYKLLVFLKVLSVHLNNSKGSLRTYGNMKLLAVVILLAAALMVSCEDATGEFQIAVPYDVIMDPMPIAEQPQSSGDNHHNHGNGHGHGHKLRCVPVA